MATEAKSGSPQKGGKTIIVPPFAEGVLWAGKNGETRYYAGVSFEGVVADNGWQQCMQENASDESKCKNSFSLRDVNALAVIEASDGGYFFAKGDSKSDAKKRGLEACEKRSNVTCKVAEVYGSGGLLDF